MAESQKLTDREDVIFGGIVTDVRQKFTKRGEPCGFVTIEDFQGSGELGLFGKDWGERSGMFTVGSAVYVTGKMQPRFQYSDQMELKVQDVQYLQAVKEKAIDRITITLSADLLDEQVVTDLGELIVENPGKTKLYFRLVDRTGKGHVLMRSTSKYVDVKSTLLRFIDQAPALDYKIN